MNGVVIAVGLAKLTQVLMRKNQLRLKMSMRSNMIRTLGGMHDALYKPPHEHTHQLYDYYVMAFEEYINANVLPSLREAHDEFLLRELVQRWMNHKIMVKWLSKFFCYLDRYFLAARCLPPVKDAGLHCFRKLLYEEINGRVKDAVMSLINREREGEQIDRTLVKNVLHIFVEIGIENLECYLNEFRIPCRVSSDPREECLQRKKLHGGTRTSNRFVAISKGQGTQHGNRYFPTQALDAEQAETKAMFEAVNWAQKKGIVNIHLERDSTVEENINQAVDRCQVELNK
ncbi:hypothetical protein MKW98_031265 [Papaver atlanticum]|uniref:Cullin N-terminal domain-containing protein n=1 Tax=Papaver atlanticum TaxID=357466 RepID=A0AAD4S5I4_9MAGN|nr:hypothetical protein MKW98_031265 [Papaver atlanticum]